MGYFLPETESGAVQRWWAEHVGVGAERQLFITAMQECISFPTGKPCWDHAGITCSVFLNEHLWGLSGEGRAVGKAKQAKISVSVPLACRTVSGLSDWSTPMPCVSSPSLLRPGSRVGDGHVRHSQKAYTGVPLEAGQTSSYPCPSWRGWTSWSLQVLFGASPLCWCL